MAIAHDTYLFNPREFANVADSYIQSLKQLNGYSLIRAEALSLYDNSEQVRHLAQLYGGWDKSALLTQVPSDHMEGPEDLAFWLILILYNKLILVSPQFGLGMYWRDLAHMLKQIGWDNEDVELLIKGYSFENFAKIWLSKDEASFYMLNQQFDCWRYIHPFSANGWAGWLDQSDIDGLLARLAHDRARLEVLEAERDTAVSDHSQSFGKNIIQGAIRILKSAQDERSGLCLILSG